MNFENEGRGLASEGPDKREAKISSGVSEAGGGEADPAIAVPLRMAEGTNRQAAGTPQVGSAQNDENDRGPTRAEAWEIQTAHSSIAIKRRRDGAGQAGPQGGQEAGPMEDGGCRSMRDLDGRQRPCQVEPGEQAQVQARSESLELPSQPGFLNQGQKIRTFLFSYCVCMLL